MILYICQKCKQKRIKEGKGKISFKIPLNIEVDKGVYEDCCPMCNSNDIKKYN